jgi:hypothetical protein
VTAFQVFSDGILDQMTQTCETTARSSNPTKLQLESGDPETRHRGRNVDSVSMATQLNWADFGTHSGLCPFRSRLPHL